MPILHRRSRLRLSIAVLLTLTLLTAGALLAQDTVTSSQTTGGIPAGPISEQPTATTMPEVLIENIAATATQIALTVEAAEARVTQAALTAEAILATAQMAATSTIAAANIPVATLVPTGPLTETFVQSNAGFSIRYPQGWVVAPQTSEREPVVLSNSPNLLTISSMNQPVRSGELAILITIPAELDRLYGLGLEADPVELLQAALDEAGFTETTAAPYAQLAVPAAIATLPEQFVGNFGSDVEAITITAQYPEIGTIAFIVFSGGPFNQQEGLVIEILNSVRPLTSPANVVLPTIAVPTVIVPTVVIATIELPTPSAPTVVIPSEEILATEIAATLMAEEPMVEETAEPTPLAVPTEIDAAASQLTEILVRADAGFSIRYPQGWVAAPQFEFEEESNLLASSAAAIEQDRGSFINITAGDVVIVLTVPEDSNRFYRLGLDADPIELMQAAISDAGYSNVNVEPYERLTVPAAIVGPLEAFAREASPGAFATALAVQYPRIGTIAFIILSGEPFAEVEPIVIEILNSVQALEAD
ncbi:MAG: hypothetical protein SNJ59_01685 [Aggregatilineales bacterium]